MNISVPAKAETAPIIRATTMKAAVPAYKKTCAEKKSPAVFSIFLKMRDRGKDIPSKTLRNLCLRKKKNNLKKSCIKLFFFIGKACKFCRGAYLYIEVKL